MARVMKSKDLLPVGSALDWHQFGAPVLSLVRPQPLAASQNRYGETAPPSPSRTENRDNQLPHNAFPENRTQRLGREENQHHGAPTQEIYATANPPASEIAQRFARGNQLGYGANARQAAQPRPQAVDEGGGDAGALAGAPHLKLRFPVPLPPGYLPGVV